MNIKKNLVFHFHIIYLSHGGIDKETKIVVKFNKDAAKIINEESGYVTYEFIAYGIDGICIDLLGLGDGFEVLEPLDLREKICNIGKRIAGNHSKDRI